MSPPKSTVTSSPAVADRHSPSPASDAFQPSSPAPPTAAVAAAAAVATTTVEPTAASDSGRLDDLETELELDLENMKLDNIDTTVS